MTKHELTELWLVTRSPRRKALLEQAGFVIAGLTNPIDVDESIAQGESARQACMRLAEKKYQAGAAEFDFTANRVLLAADTLVADPDGRVMGKPASTAQARDMLLALSGQSHAVYTAVTVGNGQTDETCLFAATVFFTRLTDALIDAYIQTGEPFDKAGGYGLQARGGMFVRKLEGEPGTVVGWPLCGGSAQLARFGVKPQWQR